MNKPVIVIGDAIRTPFALSNSQTSLAHPPTTYLGTADG